MHWTGGKSDLAATGSIERHHFTACLLRISPDGSLDTRKRDLGAYFDPQIAQKLNIFLPLRFGREFEGVLVRISSFCKKFL